MDVGPFHIGYAHSKQQFSATIDHSSGLGMHPHKTHSVGLFTISIFSSISKTSHLMMSLLIHVRAPATEFRILEQ